MQYKPKNLAEILCAFSSLGVWVDLVDGEPRIQGDTAGLDPDLVAAARTQRPHLVRLAASDARTDGGSWRRELERADADTREAWALVAAGYAAHGMADRLAEWWAWDLVGR